MTALASQDYDGVRLPTRVVIKGAAPKRRPF